MVIKISKIMIYLHQYFSLDSKSKKVFDENEKNLRITGNTYRLLVFLCEKKNANVTEIGDYLDWAKDYDENNIRQYRYKANTIVGYDVIEYRNGMYSLAGEVKETDKLDRNTDLLHNDGVELKKNNIKNDMSKPEKIKFSKTPAIIASILLLLTFFSWPYGYYTFLRIVVTGVAIYYGYYIYQQNLTEKMSIWFWGLITIIILFNPIFPIYLNKATWGILDVLTAVFFVGFVYNKKL